LVPLTVLAAGLMTLLLAFIAGAPVDVDGAVLRLLAAAPAGTALDEAAALPARTADALSVVVDD